MAYYKKKYYKRKNHKHYYQPHRRSSFYNVFSKYHSCKWKYKYYHLQRELRAEFDY